MKTQMPFNNEIEKTKQEIVVLTAKLELLKEMDKYKTPCEEAYQKVYGYFPTEPNWDDDEVRWESFQKGYNASQKDYKVGEYQPTPQEPEELKTLYQMFYDEKWSSAGCDDICKVVEEWMSQYADNVMCGEYKKGYEYCLTVLEESLK